MLQNPTETFPDLEGSLKRTPNSEQSDDFRNLFL